MCFTWVLDLLWKYKCTHLSETVLIPPPAINVHHPGYGSFGLQFIGVDSPWEGDDDDDNAEEEEGMMRRRRRRRRRRKRFVLK